MFRSCGLTGIFAFMLSIGAILLDSDAIELPNTYDRSPTAFTLDYPEDWLVQIPQPGTLLVATQSTLTGNPGPSLLVHRSELLAAVNNLDEALDVYLENGPLHPNNSWDIVIEQKTTSIGKREGLLIELMGRDIDDGPLLRTRILVARAGSGAIYFMTFTTPEDTWGDLVSTLDAIQETIEIIE